VPQSTVPPHTPSGNRALHTSAHSGVDNFTGSDGWTITLAFTFKRRYNIVYRTPAGECRSVGPQRADWKKNKV